MLCAPVTYDSDARQVLRPVRVVGRVLRAPVGQARDDAGLFRHADQIAGWVRRPLELPRYLA